MNKENGLHREKGDKRRAVQAMFRVEQMRGISRSDHEIARHCGASQQYVTQLRRAWAASNNRLLDSPSREVTRGGTTYVMDTSRIGERAPAPLIEWAPSPAPAPDRLTVVDPETGELLDVEELATKEDVVAARWAS